ncbi:TPA: tail spike protein [Raoultella ornithinolytica]|uniref:tail spike protein n=1 Tax=Raoultella ornithinolytica TaxID=54291 RepID=UPI0015DD3BBE|nr:tail spike protein [Raoultella ornithinolytica]QLK20770.1 hypothetical protein GPJ66_08150 [Raoultella ornithinolytica]WKL85377.1 tail spike protein [Raoultella ornithinolytica]HAT2374442.1 hypothetical protein [Raoultella ornithinolytica]HAU5002264.1 hypothetical protein [Raoultella ornithinolytica]HCD1179784.1 hypothetical protein [Raoultella ornithinolytica]
MMSKDRRFVLKLFFLSLAFPKKLLASTNHITGKNYLSFYGADADAFTKFLTYAKITSEECYIDIDVELKEKLEYDFNYSTIKLVFLSSTIKCDTPFLIFSSLGKNSYIKNASFTTINSPWVISRWKDNNWLTDPDEILHTLTKTFSPGYYQPTINDHDIYDLLTQEQKTQNISSGIIVKDSNDVVIINPEGVFALFEFYNCNNCTVVSPKIMSGGKGEYGTIVFNNISSPTYGYGNKVIGGEISYGSYSGITFIRNKGPNAGVWGGVKLFRCGESGVKTYQNEINSVSARCYNLIFDSIQSEQTVYDGFDFSSDYGPIRPRMMDFSLQQYPWHYLPVAHKISRLTAINCRGTGFFIDGQFSDITNLKAVKCFKDGFFINGINNKISTIDIVDCNLLNISTGVHQINIPNENSVNELSVITSNKINNGYAIYAPRSSVKNRSINSQLKSMVESAK